MSDLSYSAEQKILQLKEAYKTSLPEKLDDLNNNWQAIIKEPSNPSHIELFRVACHKLAGSSSSYGFEEISVSAKTLDELITELIKSTEHQKDVIGQLKPSFEKLAKQLQEGIVSS